MNNPASMSQTVEPVAPAFTDDDLDAFLSGAAFRESEASSRSAATSDEARNLARNLAIPYVQVVSQHAFDLATGRQERFAPKLLQVLKDARRLAEEMEDEALLEHYQALASILGDERRTFSTQHDRETSSRRLHGWVSEFAYIVGGEAGRKLLREQTLKRGVNPLVAYLREVRGLGEKRLEKLFAAGLLTTDALVDADPRELSQIVGIPMGVARLVVTAATRFADEQRVASVLGLRESALEVMRHLRDLPPTDRGLIKLVAEVRDTLHRLEATLRELGQTATEGGEK